MLVEKSKHVTEEVAMRKERYLNREDKDKLVIAFDLQIVINCPRANISPFSKLENFRCII